MNQEEEVVEAAEEVTEEAEVASAVEAVAAEEEVEVDSTEGLHKLLSQSQLTPTLLKDLCAALSSRKKCLS
jgi:transcription antitermination factor NusG